MSEQDQFKSIDYCRKEILEVRRWIQDKSKLNEHVWDTAFKILTLMLFHCPEEFVETVRAHIDECHMRYTYWLVANQTF